MGRKKSARNIYDSVDLIYEFEGIYKRVFGQPEQTGSWIIYGAEKHGKTTFALMLAKYLCTKAKVWYISAEEGTKTNFKRTMIRAEIPAYNPSLAFDDYLPLEELYKDLKKRNAARIVFIDNLTVYENEINKKVFNQLMLDFGEKVLFIFLAHYERKEPAPAVARHIKKLAQIYMYVEGLTCSVDGRCPGGTLIVNEERAELIYGDEILQNA